MQIYKIVYVSNVVIRDNASRNKCKFNCNIQVKVKLKQHFTHFGLI